MNKNHGVTLVELMIVVIIIGILAVISVPMYRNYITDGIAQEGFAVLEAINSAQNTYHAVHGTFYSLAGARTSFDTVLDINARENSYFTSFDFTGDEETWRGTAFCNKGGWNVSAYMTGYWTASPVTAIEGM